MKKIVKDYMTMKDIASELKITEQTLRLFFRYCRETGAYELPQPTFVPGVRNKYCYTMLDADDIISIYVNRIKGEMTKWCYDNVYSTAFKKKHPMGNKKK